MDTCSILGKMVSEIALCVIALDGQFAFMLGLLWCRVLGIERVWRFEEQIWAQFFYPLTLIKILSLSHLRKQGVCVVYVFVRRVH